MGNSKMWVSTFNLLTLGMKGKREQMEMLARQMRSGVGRIRAEGWKEGSVLACVLWNSLLWFVAEVTVREPGCHCLRPATVCGRLYRNANMLQFFPSFSSSLPLGQFVFSSDFCHHSAKQCSAEEDAVETQRSELENSSVRDQPGHCAGTRAKHQ